MSKYFDKPALPERLRKAAQPSEKTPEQKRQLGAIVEKYAAPSMGHSNLLGLSDATGSMAGIWEATRQNITEMIRRISEMGRMRMRWVAYRDYCDGNDILEASPWHEEAKELLRFINGIHCTGGGDYPEAVERALEFAARDDQATRIILIGDAPPHPERDYLAQAERLRKLNRPVFGFVVGEDRETMAAFAKIAKITGGECTFLKKTSDLLDLVVLTAADEMGSSTLVEEYLRKYDRQLGSGGREYARLLLKSGRERK